MYTKSPLNYTGGKYKLLNKIIPSFPQKIPQFVDLFTGGMNVGINVEADTIYANDRIDYLIELYNYFQKTPTDEIINSIKELITFYSLNQQNVDGYNKLRKDYNNQKTPLTLFVLICFAFNHQIRFNNSFEFNTSFGKNRSSYNDNIENNLIHFSTALKEKNIILTNNDFRDFNFNKIKANDLVYCDPPYLITTGSYNDGKRGFGDWKSQDDEDLMSLLDELNKRNILFALSNVFYHKGYVNEELIKWSEKYNVSYLDKKYSNCSYHFKDRNTETVEVLITNY
jgi:DNA adenine methylase